LIKRFFTNGEWAQGDYVFIGTTALKDQTVINMRTEFTAVSPSGISGSPSFMKLCWSPNPDTAYTRTFF
jgi:hypothetical protein